MLTKLWLAESGPVAMAMAVRFYVYVNLKARAVQREEAETAIYVSRVTSHLHSWTDGNKFTKEKNTNESKIMMKLYKQQQQKYQTQFMSEGKRWLWPNESKSLSWAVNLVNFEVQVAKMTSN